MLVLTRRLHEAVVIGSDVKVHVLGYKGGQVRLGIEAPSEVEVDREEVRARKKREAERLARSGRIASAGET
jgi:carbon storage regulator